MPLQESVVPVSFGGSLDTKSDPKQVLPGTMTLAENVVYTSPGRLQKRPGAVLESQLPSGVGMGAAAYGDGVVLSDGDQLWGQTDDLGNPGRQRLLPLGRLARVRGTIYPVARDTARAQINADGAYLDGLECFAWESDGHSFFKIIDADSRAEVTSGELGSGRNLSPRVVTLGGSFIVVWIKQVGLSATASLQWLSIPTAAPAAGPEQTAVAISSTVLSFLTRLPPFDVLSAEGAFWLSYANTSGNLALTRVTLAGSVATAVPGHTIDGRTAIGFDPAGGRILVASDHGDSSRLADFDATTGAHISSFTILQATDVMSEMALVVEEVNQNGTIRARVLLLFTNSNADPATRSTRAILISDIGAGWVEGSLTIMFYGITLASRGVAVAQDGAPSRQYFLLQHSSAEQSTYFMGSFAVRGDEQDVQIEGRLLPGLAGVPNHSLPSIYPRASASEFGVAVLEKTSLAKSTSEGLFALSSVDSYVFTADARQTSFEVLGESLMIRSGDMLQMFDGSSMVEDGFHLYPERVSVPNVTGTAHSYQYSATYEWTDANGIVHRSNSSTPVTMSTTNPISNTAAIQCLVSYLQITAKKDVSVVLYRTTDLGTVFYKVASVRNVVNGPLTAIFVDSLTDSDLQGVQASGSNISTPSGVALQAFGGVSVPVGLTATLVGAEVGVGLSAAEDWWFRVTAITPYGETTASSPAMQPNHPAVPYETVILNWTSSAGATGYRIYGAHVATGAGSPAASAFQLIAESSINVYEVRLWPNQTDTPPGVSAAFVPLSENVGTFPYFANGTYRYKVTAEGPNGGTAIASAETVALVVTDANNGSLHLLGHKVSWTKVPGAQGYRIYGWGPASSGVFGYLSSVAGEDATEWIDKGRSPPNLAAPAPTTNTTIRTTSAPPTVNTTGAGTVTAALHGYRVAATNTVGVTLASATVTITLGTQGAVDVTWHVVPGATGYQVFGRTSGAELLIASVQGGDTTRFHDDGSLTPSGALPGANTTGVTRRPGALQLYTTGGVLGNLAPPNAKALAVHRNRMFAIDADNRLRLCYSHQVIPGAPVEWNTDFLTINVDPAGGDVTAIAAMDDKVMIFKRDRVFFVSGQGPDRTGNNNDYSDPILVSSDAGCIAPDAIALTPKGLFFQSAKGIYLLGRDLMMTDIGAPLQRYAADLAASPLTDAALVGGENQVRFSQANRMFVYDTHVEKWSTFTVPGVVAMVVDSSGVFHSLTSIGIFGTEADGVWTDPEGAPINIVVETGWLTLSALQGFGRVRNALLLGTLESASPLVVSVAYDFDEAFSQVTNITSASVPAGAAIQERVHFTKRRCEAIKLRIAETFASPNSGPGFTLSAISLTVALKPGLRRMPASQSWGKV